MCSALQILFQKILLSVWSQFFKSVAFYVSRDVTPDTTFESDFEKTRGVSGKEGDKFARKIKGRFLGNFDSQENRSF
jgi:hypothetical protein